jgi:predicted RecB family nuclease
MLLNAELLLSYQRCERRAFLDIYGNPTQLDPFSDFHFKLQQDRFVHQRTVLADQTYHQPQYPRGDWQAGAKATLELMQQGVETIYRGVLLAESGTVEEWESGRIEEFPLLQSLPHPITLLSRPDLLIKQPGQSIFGDWLYVPSQIELGKRPKLDYQIIAAFNAQVLATVQGIIPQTVWLLLRERRPYAVNLAKAIPQMQRALDGCIQTLFSYQEPEVFISRQRCNLCRWYSHCYEIAQSQQHLSLLPGVSPSRYSYLRSLNLTTVESLADASADQLEPTIEREVAEQLVRQAQSALQNQVILTQTAPLTAEELPTASIELYFDIEAEPDINLDYLLGVLVVDRAAKTEIFYPFLAEEPAEEGLIWQQFLELIVAYPDAPIFHFCDYEVETVKRLAKCYKTPSEQIQPILARFVDIHERVKQAATLPIESYALKHIARWLGFEWHNPKANGQLCIYWYDQWLKLGDRTFLDLILRYNEDDCRATHRVKDWLVNLIEDSLQNTA